MSDTTILPLHSQAGAIAIADVKQLIIQALALEDVEPADIEADAPLFGSAAGKGLGLDSIDALELGLALQKKYGVKLSADPAANREHFASAQSICNLINSQLSV